jgi:hypothetical protein
VPVGLDGADAAAQRADFGVIGHRLISSPSQRRQRRSNSACGR